MTKKGLTPKRRDSQVEVNVWEDMRPVRRVRGRDIGLGTNGFNILLLVWMFTHISSPVGRVEVSSGNVCSVAVHVPSLGLADLVQDCLYHADLEGGETKREESSGI